MEREIASNYCKKCEKTFNTLADEKHDVCGNCLNDEYLESIEIQEFNREYKEDV